MRAKLIDQHIESLSTENGFDIEKDVTEGVTLDSIVTLKDIDVRVKQGEFVCVIGDVGSGKSSLLNSLIGDMLCMSKDCFNKYENGY